MINPKLLNKTSMLLSESLYEISRGSHLYKISSFAIHQYFLKYSFEAVLKKKYYWLKSDSYGTILDLNVKVDGQITVRVVSSTYSNTTYTYNMKDLNEWNLV